MNTTFLPNRRRCLALGGSLAASLALPGLARAQAAWPSKAIRFVVPFAPGGSSEIVARTTAFELSKALGQSVYVENKPGGAGNVAMQEVARAEDQHTIILGHIGTLAVNPYIFDKLPYDPVKDFKPVSLLAKVPSLYLVRPDLPVKDLREFIAYAKKNPGKLNYGSAGNGSAGHLAMEYLKMAIETFILHVPNRGTGPQLTDLLAGRLDAASVGGAAAGLDREAQRRRRHRHRRHTGGVPQVHRRRTAALEGGDRTGEDPAGLSRWCGAEWRVPVSGHGRATIPA